MSRNILSAPWRSETTRKLPGLNRVTVKSAGGAGTHTGGTHTGHTGAQGHTVKLTVQFSRPRRRSSAQLRPRTTTSHMHQIETLINTYSVQKHWGEPVHTGRNPWTKSTGTVRVILFKTPWTPVRGSRTHTTCRWGRDVVLRPACALVGCAGRPIAQGGPPAALSFYLHGRGRQESENLRSAFSDSATLTSTDKKLRCLSDLHVAADADRKPEKRESRHVNRVPSSAIP